jgi:hypothetical protein
LRSRDRAQHVHSRAEHALASAGEHDRADRVVGGELAPRRGEVAQHAGVERVRLVGAIERDERDVRVRGRAFEADWHGQSMGEFAPHHLIPSQSGSVAAPSAAGCIRRSMRS